MNDTDDAEYTMEGGILADTARRLVVQFSEVPAYH